MDSLPAELGEAPYYTLIWIKSHPQSLCWLNCLPIKTYFDMFSVFYFSVYISDFRGEKNEFSRNLNTKQQEWQLNIVGVTDLWLKNSDTESCAKMLFNNPAVGAAPLYQGVRRGAFQVVQWLRTHLPRQGTWVWSLDQEDPTCLGATKSMCHSYRAHWVCVLVWTATAEACVPRTRALQHEKPWQWEGCPAQLKNSPSSLQLEKACVQQWRPSSQKKI